MVTARMSVCPRSFQKGMDQCKHSWMRVFISSISIIALLFCRLPKAVMYTKNINLNSLSCFAAKVLAQKSWNSGDIHLHISKAALFKIFIM